MKEPIFNSPLTLVRIVCITMCVVLFISCNSSDVSKRGDKVFHIIDFNIEKVVGGIPSNSLTYNLRLTLEFKKKTSVKLNSMQFADSESAIWILENGVILKKADVESAYLKGERVDVFANFSGINSSSLPETVDSTGVTIFNESYMIYEDSKGKIRKINLGQPDKVTNFLAQ